MLNKKLKSYSVVLFLTCMLLIAGVVYADGAFWSTPTGAPGSGNFTGSNQSSNTIRGEATGISWGSTFWLGSSAEMEIGWPNVNGNECGTPHGDPMRHKSVWASLPNNGAVGESSCGSTPASEIDLLINKSQVATQTSYTYGVDFWCLKTGNWDIGVEWQNSSTGGVTQIQRTDDRSCTSTVSSLTSDGNQNESTTLPNVFVEAKQSLVMTDTIGGYGYELYQSGDTYRAKTVALFDSIASVHEKMMENQAYLHSLQSVRDGSENVLVAITFADAIDKETATEFVQETGMEVLQYGVFGVDQSNQTFSSYHTPLNGSIEDVPDFYETGAGVVTNDGIMTIQAITSISVVQQLNDRDDIALLDLSANMIQDTIAQDVGVELNLRSLYTPNPAWLLFTDQPTAPTSVSLSTINADKMPPDVALLLFVIVVSSTALILVGRHLHSAIRKA